ncbi:MAG: hypothetical protein QY318_04220 [Candidatus Dojkabacteria bacterium]|nr:MAG: hypothetical protein QY318_04220 [Candidatus Dojkabacteria bacterium]
MDINGVNIPKRAAGIDLQRQIEGTPFAPGENVFERIDPMLATDAGRIIGAIFKDMMNGTSSFTYEGSFAFAPEVEQQEEFQSVVEKINQLGTLLKENHLIGLGYHELEQLNNGLLRNKDLYDQVVSLLSECTDAGLADLFIHCGLYTSSSAGYIDNHGRLAYLTEDGRTDQFEQLIARWKKTYEFVLLNILLFTGRPEPGSTSTLQTIASGREILAEKTLSTRPRSMTGKRLQGRVEMYQDIVSTLGDLDYVDLLFNPSASFLTNGMQAFLSALDDSANKSRGKYQVLANSLKDGDSQTMFKRFISLPQRDYRGLLNELSNNPDFAHIQAEIAAYRNVWLLARDLSGHIKLGKLATAIKTRPDALFLTGNWQLRNGTIRLLDKCYRDFSESYKDFLGWLEVNDPEFCMELEKSVSKSASGKFFFDPESDWVIPEVREAYSRYVEESGASVVPAGIEIFELKTGGVDDATHRTQRRRFLIVLLSLYAENRLPHQSLSDWLRSRQNPLLFFYLSNTLRIEQSILKTAGTLSEYLNYDPLTQEIKPPFTPAVFYREKMIDALPAILKEVGILKNELDFLLNSSAGD